MEAVAEIGNTYEGQRKIFVTKLLHLNLSDAFRGSALVIQAKKGVFLQNVHELLLLEHLRDRVVPFMREDGEDWPMWLHAFVIFNRIVGVMPLDLRLLEACSRRHRTSFATGQHDEKQNRREGLHGFAER